MATAANHPAQADQFLRCAHAPPPAAIAVFRTPLRRRRPPGITPSAKSRRSMAAPTLTWLCKPLLIPLKMSRIPASGLCCSPTGMVLWMRRPSPKLTGQRSRLTPSPLALGPTTRCWTRLPRQRAGTLPPPINRPAPASWITNPFPTTRSIADMAASRLGDSELSRTATRMAHTHTRTRRRREQTRRPAKPNLPPPLPGTAPGTQPEMPQWKPPHPQLSCRLRQPDSIFHRPQRLSGGIIAPASDANSDDWLRAGGDGYCTVRFCRLRRPLIYYREAPRASGGKRLAMRSSSGAEGCDGFDRFSLSR